MSIYSLSSEKSQRFKSSSAHRLFRYPKQNSDHLLW